MHTYWVSDVGIHSNAPCEAIKMEKTKKDTNFFGSPLGTFLLFTGLSGLT